MNSESHACQRQAGCPIQKSPDRNLVADSPELIAGLRVFHRLLLPRHPPRALIFLTHCFDAVQRFYLVQEHNF